MVLETHMGLYMTDPDFLEKKTFCPKNWEKRPKMGQE